MAQDGGLLKTGKNDTVGHIRFLQYFCPDDMNPSVLSVISLKFWSYYGACFPNVDAWKKNYRYCESDKQPLIKFHFIWGTALNISVALRIRDELVFNVSSCSPLSYFCQFSLLCFYIWMSTRGGNGHSWSLASGWPAAKCCLHWKKFTYLFYLNLPESEYQVW